MNSVIGLGKNWNLPFIWAPLLRYFSGPVLAIIFSLAYPSFETLSNDPLQVYGFIIAHFLLLWIVAGFFMPRWFSVFIIPERHDDWKQPYAPNVVRDTSEGEVADSLETGSTSRPGSSKEKAGDDTNGGMRQEEALVAESSRSPRSPRL
jgi:solute carrier family 6 (neurotransmitter transporter, GABA) member 1